PRGPSADITAHATSRKSARVTISSLVTACTTGSVWSALPPMVAGRAFTVGSSMLPLRGSRRGGVETVADGDAAAVGPLEGAETALAGGLHHGDAQCTAPAGDEHSRLVDREHLARSVRAPARRDPRPEQLHLGAVHAPPCARLGVVGANVPPHLVCPGPPVDEPRL